MATERGHLGAVLRQWFLPLVHFIQRHFRLNHLQLLLDEAGAGQLLIQIGNYEITVRAPAQLQSAQNRTNAPTPV